MKYVDNLKSGMSGRKGILFAVGAIVAAVIGWNYLAAPEPASNPSTVNTSAMNVPTVQGGETPLDPEYREALEQSDSQRAEEARETGTTAVPTIQNTMLDQEQPLLVIDEPQDVTPDIETPDLDIAHQPIVVQPEPAPAQPFVTASPAAPVAANPERVNSMIEALARRPFPVAQVTDFGAVIPEETAEAQSPPAVPAAAGGPASKVKLPLAGTVLYAQMVGTANSDHPGPVLARILQGELTGATLIGSFQVARNALVINFDRMSVGTTRSGEEINEVVEIEAVAVDTANIGTGLATKVDRHLFQKLGIAFASGFAQGIGQAVSQTGTTTISIDTGGGTSSSTSTQDDLDAEEELKVASGQALSEAGSLIQQEFGNMPTTITVQAGTPIGVLFLQ